MTGGPRRDQLLGVIRADQKTILMIDDDGTYFTVLTGPRCAALRSPSTRTLWVVGDLPVRSEGQLLSTLAGHLDFAIEGGGLAPVLMAASTYRQHRLFEFLPDRTTL
jgi:hypothetical protein